MSQRIINIFLFIFLSAFPVYLAYGLYNLDKVYFFCPILYRQDTIIIRHDSYGSGDFLADRSGFRKHNGIDLQAKIGAPVYAVKSGRVISAGSHRGLGNYVELIHPGGLVSIYGHLSQINIRENQRVKQGDKVGEAGKTGNANHRSIIPHLHFEVRQDGIPLDPMAFLE